MFNWFDIALLLIIIASAVAGLRSGFARVAVGLIATVVGLIAGFWSYRIVAAKLLPWVKNPTVANLLGFFTIFIGVLILGALIAALLSRFFNWIGLSWFDHLLGGVAGFLRGALLIAVLVDMAVAFAPSPTPQVLEHSRVLPFASNIAGWLVEMAPRDLKDAFEQQMQNLKQLWEKPAERRGQEV
jgi:membrane protein required for colicin V production